MTLFYTLVFGKEIQFTRSKVYLIITLIQQNSLLRFCYIQGRWRETIKGYEAENFITF